HALLLPYMTTCIPSFRASFERENPASLRGEDHNGHSSMCSSISYFPCTKRCLVFDTSCLKERLCRNPARFLRLFQPVAIITLIPPLKAAKETAMFPSCFRMPSR